MEVEMFLPVQHVSVAFREGGWAAASLHVSSDLISGPWGLWGDARQLYSPVCVDDVRQSYCILLPWSPHLLCLYETHNKWKGLQIIHETFPEMFLIMNVLNKLEPDSRKQRAHIVDDTFKDAELSVIRLYGNIFFFCAFSVSFYVPIINNGLMPCCLSHITVTGFPFV